MSECVCVSVCDSLCVCSFKWAITVFENQEKYKLFNSVQNIE